MFSSMRQSDMLQCPFAIIVPEHYSNDGHCKCYLVEERARMVAEWEYTDQDFVDAGVASYVVQGCHNNYAHSIILGCLSTLEQATTLFAEYAQMRPAWLELVSPSGQVLQSC